MKNEIDIKLLVEYKQHIPHLAKLSYEQLGKHWNPNATIEGTEQKLLDHANHNQLPMTLVAFENEHPIGIASLRATDGIQPELTPWLGGLVVNPLHRRKKAGELLINAVKQQTLNFGYDKLYLLAFDATIPNWYASLGWKKIGVDQLFGHMVTVMDIHL